MDEGRQEVSANIALRALPAGQSSSLQPELVLGPLESVFGQGAELIPEVISVVTQDTSDPTS